MNSNTIDIIDNIIPAIPLNIVPAFKDQQRQHDCKQGILMLSHLFQMFLKNKLNHINKFDSYLSIRISLEGNLLILYKYKISNKN